MKELLTELYELYLDEDYLMGLNLIREDIADTLEETSEDGEMIDHTRNIVAACDEEDWDKALSLVGQLKQYVDQ